MKVSLNLLRTFANFDQPLNQLVELIGARIGEVEEIAELGPLYKGIVVSEIVEAKPHPDADKLGVYKISTGRNTVQVVAGDKTLRVGNRVAYIPPGTVVPATASDEQPLIISERSLRGELSQGMLGSARELAFGADHEGVLKLDDVGQIGQFLAEVYQLDDVILDIETKVLTHRADMFGHLGFARELAGVLDQPFTSPGWWKPEPSWAKPETTLPLKINIAGTKQVPRFNASVFAGVKVGPGPIQIQTWLNRLGVRPLNNVVDLTNYLMLLTGQPLHAFDYDKVLKVGGAAELTARVGKDGEKLTLLDGRTIELTSDDLVIAGPSAPLSLAGVMGGAATEVDDSTKNVIIEAANFDMYAIRNTSMRHGIQSEAVTRFARGQDPAFIPAVQGQVRTHLEQLGVAAASNLLDKYPAPAKTRSVSVQAKRINELLGLKLKSADMARRLRNVELKTKLSGDKLTVQPPPWRPDLNLAEDLVEEIGRLNGYDRIKPRLPLRSLAAAPIEPLEDLRRQAATLLSAAGGSELLTYSGVSRDLLAAAGQDAAYAYEIRNALSPDLHHMRLSLVPSLLSKVSPNLRRGYERFVLFEIGAVHHKTLLDGGLPAEQTALALVFAAGSKTAPRGAPYYQAAYYLSHLLHRLGFAFSLSVSFDAHDPWLVQTAAPFAHARRASVIVGDQTVGVVGELAAATVRRLKLPAATCAFELNLGRLLGATKGEQTAYRPLSRFPHVLADLTLKVPAEVKFAQLLSTLEAARPKPPLELAIRPLGIYQSSHSTKNVTFRLDFVSFERTLKQAEVNELVASLAASAQNLGAKVV